MEQLLDIAKAAKALSISPWTVRSYIRSGKLRPVRLGRRVLLTAWLDSAWLGSAGLIPHGYFSRRGAFPLLPFWLTHNAFSTHVRWSCRTSDRLLGVSLSRLAHRLLAHGFLARIVADPRY